MRAPKKFYTGKGRKPQKIAADSPEEKSEAKVKSKKRIAEESSVEG